MRPASGELRHGGFGWSARITISDRDRRSFYLGRDESFARARCRELARIAIRVRGGPPAAVAVLPRLLEMASRVPDRSFRAYQDAAEKLATGEFSSAPPMVRVMGLGELAVIEPIPSASGIYLTAPLGVEWVKLGFASNIRRRIREQHQTSHPERLYLVAYDWKSVAADEVAAKERFRPLRFGNGGTEIYRLEGEIAEYVAELRRRPSPPC